MPPTCQVMTCSMVQAHPVLPAQRCRCGDGRLPLVLLVMVIASALTAAAAPFVLRPGPDVSTAASLGQLTCFDYNGDGQADVVGINARDGALTVIPRTTSGYGAPAAAGSFADPHGTVVAGDVTGDGIADLLGQDGLDILWLQGHSSESQLAPSDFLVDDTNADGRPDLIVASEIGGTISVFLNEAAPSWPGYAAWAAANGLAQDSMSTDPDHDGRDNLEE